MGWPCRLGGDIVIPSHDPRSVESLVASLTPILAPLITPNTPVALYRLPQSTALSAFFAVSRLRAIPVFLNDRYTLSDIRRALNTLPTTALLTAPGVEDTVRDTVPLVVTIHAERSNPFQYTVTPSYFSSRSSRTSNLPEQTAAVFFTSGTTFTPKPVPLTYQNLLSQSHAKITYLPLSAASTYLHLAPLYHLAGFSSTLAVILSKASHIIPQHLHPSNPTHGAQLLSLVRRYAATLLVAVPATFRLLLDASDHPLPSVKTLLYGGSAASPSLLKHLRVTFPNTEILGTYGMTETASSLTLARGIGPSHPFPHVRLCILRDDGTIVEYGRGEILTRGPQVFPGYYGRQKEGFIQGWFRTGDIGELTQTGLILIGRNVEMIKSGGEKVYAGEVETVLMGHSSVREAAVVGVPDRVLGEAVAACVVLDGDAGKDIIQTLQQFCRSVLAHFKCPRWILATEDLPRNATGKVAKAKVRQIMEYNLIRRAKL